jgi:RNA polymerase sigma factor (sigma-70 family)
MLLDEKEIIGQILSGHTDSFRLLVERYQGLIFSICFQMAGDRQEAENLTQDTFIKVYNSLSTYAFKGFKTWICRIAVNRCIDYKRALAKRQEQLVPPDELVKYGPDENAQVEDDLLRKEEAQAVREMCGILPEIYQQVLTEYYLNSKSVRQIATESDLKVKTVETRLYRGLKMLRHKWKEGCR